MFLPGATHGEAMYEDDGATDGATTAYVAASVSDGEVASTWTPVSWTYGADSSSVQVSVDTPSSRN